MLWTRAPISFRGLRLTVDAADRPQGIHHTCSETTPLKQLNISWQLNFVHVRTQQLKHEFELYHII